MDSIAVKSITEAFTLIIQNASKVGTPQGNPTGVNWVAILILGSLCILGLVVVDRRSNRLRNRIDSERKAERIQERLDAAKHVEDAKREAAEERQRIADANRDARERDETAARERARADQADREQARNKLMEHVDIVIDRLQSAMLAHIGKLEQRIGDLQGKVEDHARCIVSLEKDVERLQDELKELKK